MRKGSDIRGIDVRDKRVIEVRARITNDTRKRLRAEAAEYTAPHIDHDFGWDNPFVLADRFGKSSFDVVLSSKDDPAFNVLLAPDGQVVRA